MATFSSSPRTVCSGTHFRQSTSASKARPTRGPRRPNCCPSTQLRAPPSQPQRPRPRRMRATQRCERGVIKWFRSTPTARRLSGRTQPIVSVCHARLSPQQRYDTTCRIIQPRVLSDVATSGMAPTTPAHNHHARLARPIELTRLVVSIYAGCCVKYRRMQPIVVTRHTVATVTAPHIPALSQLIVQRCQKNADSYRAAGAEEAYRGYEGHPQRDFVVPAGKCACWRRCDTRIWETYG